MRKKKRRVEVDRAIRRKRRIWTGLRMKKKITGEGPSAKGRGILYEGSKVKLTKR